MDGESRLSLFGIMHDRDLMKACIVADLFFFINCDHENGLLSTSGHISC